MCGIVAAIAEREVSRLLVQGIEALEYRGYDSAGIAVITQQKQLKICKQVGKVARLIEALEEEPVTGYVGIAHTRWATHGKPVQVNAHPHVSHNEFTIVHNGIIENYKELKKQLELDGFEFSSETDTEVVVHLIKQLYPKYDDLHLTMEKVAKMLTGAYSIAVITPFEPDLIVGIKSGSPLLIGIGIGEHYLASSTQALAGVTNSFVSLEDGDVVSITRESYKVSQNGSVATRSPFKETATCQQTEKGEYRHFMLKEIMEQPSVINDTLSGKLGETQLLEGLLGPNTKELLEQIESVQIVACGTSYHAGLIAKFWIEGMAKIPVSVDIGSEYRYKDPIVSSRCLFLTISQSGETADLLAALKMAKGLGYYASSTICNVGSSSLVRESDYALLTDAGIEIGVASTKAFTTQLIALFLLAMNLCKYGSNEVFEESELVKELHKISSTVNKSLQLKSGIESLAENFSEKSHTLFLGRGLLYPIAMEAALKLKEISYIHAESYPAGELKHGPLALVDEDMPVVAVAPDNQLLEKLQSNIEEVSARGGELYIIAEETVARHFHGSVKHVIEVPACHSLLAPIIQVIPFQLLAYYVAVLKGTDVDQPRNLAKSVTVE